jgi:hypothetical protein
MLGAAAAGAEPFVEGAAAPFAEAARPGLKVGGSDPFLETPFLEAPLPLYE